MRICLLIESFYPVTGGAESQARAWVEYCVRQHIPIFVISGHVPEDAKHEEMLFGARVLRIPPAGNRPGIKRWPMIVTAFYYLIRERRSYDIIMVDGFRTLGISAVLAGKLLGKFVMLKPENIGEMSGEIF